MERLGSSGERDGGDDGLQWSARTPLVGRLRADGPRAALTFAGQGVDALGEIAAVLAECPPARPLVAAASAGLAELLGAQAFRWSGLVDAGIDPLGWVEHPERRPPAAYLTSTLVSQPLIFVAQVARFRALWERGLSGALRRGGVSAVTGHSQGLMAALLVAESPGGLVQTGRFVELVRYFAWQGLHMARSGAGFEAAGEATPMAAVSGLDEPALQAIVDRVVARTGAGLYLTLLNTRTRLVVSGQPAALEALQAAVAADRRPTTWEWLAVGGPFHSPLMVAGRAAMAETLAAEGLRFDAAALALPLLDPADGARLNDVADLAGALLDSQFTRPVRWADTMRALVADGQADVVLDCGPGDGVARLTSVALRGAGVPVAALTTTAGREVLFTAGAAPAPSPRGADFAPGVARLPDGRLVLDNRYTRATGESPVILPGMTPTTVDTAIVAAAANGGFTAELAGGGQPTAGVLAQRLAELAARLAPGRTATFNALYLDRHLWNLHLGTEGRVLEAIRAGAPLAGVTISAGIPPVDEAVALLDALVAAGARVNAFKPGTVAQVEQVLRIAAAAPHHTLFVHLEGGKAGGHHSWEDLDALLLATWHRLRAAPNVILCVGGGIGDEARATALLTGTWAEAHGQPALPVDAILLGTVAMACAEAATATAVKQALVAAPGTPAWVQTGESSGGITSGKSGLNADIHYLDNAAARCGRLLDAVAGDAAAVAAQRDAIIAALAATARPYFGDIERMTWQAAAERLVGLLAVGRGGPGEEGVWPDPSYRARVADFLRLAEARLAVAPTPSVVDDLADPVATLAALVARHPTAATERVHPADARAFVHQICARPGKPVCFVPVIDADVRRWYKADSLWQAHDDRYGADGVLVIPGPEAVAGIRRADEPVADLLGRFEAACVTARLESGITPVDRPRRAAFVAPALAGVRTDRVGAELRLRAGADADATAWLDAVAARYHGPVAALCGAAALVEDRRRRPNPVRLIAQAALDATLRLTLDGDALTALRWTSGDGAECLTLTATDAGAVELCLHPAALPDGRGGAPWRLTLAAGPLDGLRTVHVAADAARDALRALYLGALFDDAPAPVALFATATDTVVVDDARARAHGGLTGHPGVADELAFSLAWRPLFRVIAGDELAPGLLRLVHLDQSVEIVGAWPPAAGEALVAEARVTRVEDAATGRTIRAVATLRRGDAVVARLASGFFIRGDHGDTPWATRAREHVVEALAPLDAGSLAFLADHGWLTLAPPLASGDVVTVDATLTEDRPRAGAARHTATGALRVGDRVVGTLALDATGAGEHPVRALIDLLAAPSTRVDTPARRLAATTVHCPARLDAFAEVGLDHNPIHRSPAFARLAGLDQPIVHGMWTAARLHAFALARLAGGRRERLEGWTVRFTAPALPGDALALEARRVGTEGGALHVELVARGPRGPVARATARLLPPRTALLFPGQGIQRQGMGMEGYARSAAARAVWDRADACTRDRLGFSILRVVRENPKTLLVNGETHRHPEGVLHLTRFTQPAMAVLAMAQVAELRAAGVLPADAIACGHSVGEYNALAAVIEVLPLEAVVEIVYQRGTVMHRFVPRDAAGRSPYAMGVIRPNLAGLDQAGALDLVDEIANETGRFLQVVNHNVRDRQYAVTGHVDALEALAARLAARSSARRPAYVPVPGVDVPFHSDVLRDGVAAFRATLEDRLPATVDPARLVDRYVPNLVALPFRLEPAFAEAMLAVTGSPVIEALLAGWDEAARAPSALARTLLVELLAWQFASPVRWIETQELLIRGADAGGLGAERALEVGVGYQPTVANMMRQTLQSLDAAGVEVLNIEADALRVLARDEDEAPAPEAPAAPAAPPVAAAPVVAAPVAEVAPAPAAAVAAVADQPISTGEALKTLLALQARVRPEQIRDDETIDGLFEGVSSRRNQVLLDLGVEFEPGTLDAAHEVPIAALAAELARRARRYTHPGPYLQAAQDEALRRVLGRAGLVRKDAVAHLESTWSAGPGQIGGVLDALALEAREGASGRGGALGLLADAAPTQRARRPGRARPGRRGVRRPHRRPLARRQAAGGAGGTVDAAAVRALEDRLVGADGVLLQSARDLAARLGHPFPGAPAPAGPHPDTVALAALEAEHGAGYAELVAPRFDARKHLPLLDNLPFARRDVARLYHEARRGHDVAEAAARLAPWVQAAPLVAQTAAWYADRAQRAGDAALAATLAGLATRPASPRPLQPTRPVVDVRADGRLVARDVPDPQAPDLAAFLAGLGDAVRADDAAVDARLRSANPLEFQGRTAVVSGASPGSIALEMVRALLRGGARVVVTTTTHTRARRRFYRQVFRQEAGPGAELHVVPANMASFTDVDALVDWLFDARTEQAGATVRVVKPAFSPDLLLPFGALGDAATLDRLDGRALAALRVMLVGVERLIARVARRHLAQGVPAGGCHVVLPLSPNHGAFGGDGAYAEAKAALEVLLTRWHSEHDAWGRAVTLCGARIGWVRGTGLMDANDAVAARLEAATGLRTFSTPEMGHLLAALCTEPVRAAAARRPLQVDLTAGFDAITDLRGVVGGLRAALADEAAAAKRHDGLRRAEASRLDPTPPAALVTPAPAWPPRDAPAPAVAWPATAASPREQVVIVGFGEVGPCGSARTRFDLEVSDELSPASVLELAWMTGLVRYERAGFVDAATGEPVPEAGLAARYGEAVRQRVGIRWIEPGGHHDPSRLPVHATVYLDRDFTFPVSSRAEAEAFAAADAEGTQVGYDARAETWTVTRRAGSEVKVLRHARLTRQVAGILPEGFDFSRFGVPADMAERVDPVALFNLIATVDAFRQAGLDPEELLAHVHPARVANTQGAGIGGMASLRRLYQDHILGNARQGDVLQETLINVAAAYVVQTYVGSYGAMAHPVGACATAAVSLEEGLDKILAGKAEVVVAGGFDDIGPEGAVGFADMDATADSDEMVALGLEPDELSRANDARRRGFVEAQGGGTLLLARGDVALRLGLPVYGVLAWAGSFGDGIQQSVPAPGMGALAAALGGPASPLGEALARHGLTADDVALVYKHDTSTLANDLNENALHHRMQAALGRTPGNPLFVVSQKTLTGHSKGGAAAWQVHGALQALGSGVIPGNRNLDAVDPAMAAYSHMAFTDESLTASEPLRAAVVTSLGFGHVSAVALVLHPEAFRATLDPVARAAWEATAAERVDRGWRERAAVWMDEAPHFTKRQHRRFQAADGSRAQADEEAAMLLDPAARLGAAGVFRGGPTP
ncbi:MAG: DUF1729 domain-containing protein [Myxococcales bacterium]|nr:DUF1729 domain-containing protein [Myxococcales bacterium]